MKSEKAGISFRISVSSSHSHWLALIIRYISSFRMDPTTVNFGCYEQLLFPIRSTTHTNAAINHELTLLLIPVPCDRWRPIRVPLGSTLRCGLNCLRNPEPIDWVLPRPQSLFVPFFRLASRVWDLRCCCSANEQKKQLQNLSTYPLNSLMKSSVSHGWNAMQIPFNWISNCNCISIHTWNRQLWLNGCVYVFVRACGCVYTEL